MHVPPGFTHVFPYIFAKNARSYLNFLRDGLDGEVLDIIAGPDGAVRNAHVRFGDTTIMVSEAVSGFEGMRSTFYRYVADADAAMARAISSGGLLFMAAQDMPYGDRQGGVTDPIGNIWWISQRLKPGPY